MMKHKYTFAALAAFAFMFASQALATLPAPTSATFAKGAKFTVAGYTNATGTARSELSNFPVLVRVATNSPSGFQYSEMQHADATDKNDIDIAFVDMSGKGLPFEIDTWDTNSTSLIWVTLPTMTNGTEFVMCWGSASSGKIVCDDNPWTDYAGVWHMNDPGNGVTNVCDSTDNHLDGTTVSSSTSKTDGKIGGARFITSNASNAANNPYDSGITVNLASDTKKKAVVDGLVPEFTVSMWIRPQNTSGKSQYNYLVARRGADKGEGWGAQFDADDNKFSPLRMYAAKETDDHKDNRGDPANKKVVTAAVSGIKYKEWHKVDLVWTAAAKYVIYVDGEQKATDDLTRDVASNGDVVNLSLGGSLAPVKSADKSGRGFYGDMDEFRIRRGTNSLDWIVADYTQQNGTSLLTAGTAGPLAETSDPVAGVAIRSFAYTNATIEAVVSSLGSGANFADVTVEIATADSFASPVWTETYNATDAGSRLFDVAGLATNTTYFVRAVLTNNAGSSLTTRTATFTTLTPGAPVGSSIFLERGFTTLSAGVTATSFGSGSESATVRLEASTDGFTTIAAYSECAATLNEQVELVVSNLTPGTEYALRVRIQNDWGVDTYIGLPPAYTRAVPFATTGIGWTFSQDGSTINITLGISDVYDGATGSATLTYNGADKGAKEVTGATTLTWPGINTASGSATATVVLSAELDGQTYSQSFTATIAAGSTSAAVDDIMDHASAATAIRVKPGDVVTLPELYGTAYYIVGNKLFGSLEGNVLTALRPGILGIHCVGSDGATNTMAVLVLPEQIEGGDIYVFKEKHAGKWASAATWDRIGVAENDSYPNGPEDIAIIPYYETAGYNISVEDEDIVVGSLYFGRYCDGRAALEIKGGSSGSLAFRRDDDNPALVQLCSCSTDLGNNTYRVQLTFHSSLPSVKFSSDTTLSGGWDGTNPNHPQGRFAFDMKQLSIPDGVTVTLVEMDTQGLSYNQGTLSLGNLAGAGTFWNRSSGLVRYSGGSSSFTGLVRCSGGHNAGGESQGRTGPAYFRTTSLTNAAAEVVGWVGSNGQDPQSEYKRGVGALYTGYPHSHEVDKPHRSYFPARGATMHGGYIINRYIGSGAWTNSAENSITRDVKRTDFLRVEAGFNFLYGDANSDDHPGNDFIADALVHENKATLRINDSSRYSLASSVETPRQTTVLHGVSAFAVGKGEDPEQSPAYSIVPWIVGPVVSGNDNYIMIFGCFDAADRYIRPDYSSKALSEWGALDNAVVWTKDMTSITLDADKTLNSLVLDNSGISSSDKCLGDGRKLTIASGGLVFTKSGASVGTENGGTANGTLVLGDADHPAYVWARGSAESPNHIWAKVSASGGFVSAYTGNLILGGDQTGIGDEIAVNAGVLQLGTAESACQLARDLPIRIFANATLKLPNASSTTGNILKFDGAAGWFGKVEVPSGVAAKCRKAYWRDYPETPEWQNLKRGVYTGDEATALATGAIYDPDHFAGAGTLNVLKDDSTQPLLIWLR